METAISGVRHFLSEEEGVTMVEYGLLAALISAVVLAMVSAIGTNLNLAFTQICNELADAVGAADCA